MFYPSDNTLLTRVKLPQVFEQKVIGTKELGKNLPAIKHVSPERAKSNKELAAPAPYYILLVVPARRRSPLLLRRGGASVNLP